MPSKAYDYAYDFDYQPMAKTPMTVGSPWDVVKSQAAGLFASDSGPEPDRLREVVGEDVYGEMTGDAFSGGAKGLIQTPGYDALGKEIEGFQRHAMNEAEQGYEVSNEDFNPLLDIALDAQKKDLAPWDDRGRLLPYEPTDPGQSPAFFPPGGYEELEAAKAAGEEMMVDYPTIANDPNVWYPDKEAATEFDTYWDDSTI